jgi:hypothetical protein
VATPARQFELLRRWSYLLDSVFRVPGTNIRFGWDPIIGLIPGLGDLSSPAFAVLLLLQARRMRVPRIVQLRMLLNAGIDAMLGFVPGLGNLVDVAWKANARNMTLLERHAQPGVPPRRSDVLFVYGVIILLVFVALAPVFALAWLVSRMVA